MSELFQRYGKSLTAIIVGLTAFWLILLVVLPYTIMFEHSLRLYLPQSEIGGPKDVYTFANYATFLFGETSGIHIRIFILTVVYSALVTLICFVLSYPLAYYIAKVAKPSDAPTLFLLLMIPLWVSEILRSFAWFIILNFQGPLNTLLLALGIIDAPIRWIAGFNGVVVGLIYAYVLFMLLPIYSSIQSLDSNQIEAAKDLGASTWRIHFRVIMPHARPGIASGCVMVFMLSAGSLIVPSLLASPGSRWFTEIIQNWFFEGQDWHTGSAYAFLLLLLCTSFVLLMMRLFRVRLSDIAK